MASQNLTFLTLPKGVQNLAGKLFGRLLVLGHAGSVDVGNGKKKRAWWCKCGCGKVFSIRANSLLSGNSKSCGCTRGGEVKHGGSRRGKRFPEYNVWSLMIKRCHAAGSTDFNNYGGRGIKVCRRWINSFDKFLKDVGRRPSSKHTLDRLNNDGDYEPANCRWATRTEQARNKRNNHLITFGGKTMCIAQWSDELQVSQRILIDRIHRKWTIQRAFTQPVVKRPTANSRER